MRRTSALLCVAVLPLAAAVTLATPAAADAATAPTVTGVIPYGVPLTGGAITVRGTGFTSSATVAVDGTAATHVTVVSGTQLTATAPAHRAGVVEVGVTTPAGTSASVAADVLDYRAAPAVTEVDPIAGPVAGGTTVTVTGTDLDDTTGVLFGSTPATHVVQVSPTVVTAVAPKHMAGKVAVRVVTRFGTSAAPDQYSITDYYTYGGLSLLTRALRVPAGHRARSTHVAQFACPAVGSCYAVGSYVDAATGVTRPLLDRIVRGVPAAIGTGERSDIGAGELDAITCPSAARCYAIGRVRNHGATTPSTLLLTLSGTSWHPVRAAAGIAWDHLTCATVTDCIASGQAERAGATSGSGAPVFLQIHDRTATLQHGATPSGTSPSVGGLTCSSVTDCVQWGQDGGTKSRRAYVEVRRGSTWHAYAVPAFGDPLGYVILAVELDAVACSSPAHCVGYGSYERYNTAESFAEWGPIATTITTRPGKVTMPLFTNPESSSGYAPGALAPMTCLAVDSCYAAERYPVPSFTGSVDRLDAGTWTNETVSGYLDLTRVDDLACAAGPVCLLTGLEAANVPTPHATRPIAYFGNGPAYTAYELPLLAAPTVSAAAGEVGCATAGYCAVAVTAGASDYVVTTSTGVLPGSGPTPPAPPRGPAPTVTAVTPWQVSAQDGGKVTITGTHLTGATSVQFGGAAGTGLRVTSPTSLTVTAPATSDGADALVDVRVVTSTGGTSAITAGDVLKYRAAPSIDVVSPIGGPAAGGTTVMITGADLDDVTGVTFGGTPATAVTPVSPTTLTVTSPAHAAGPADIVVTTRWGTSGTSTFYYGTDLSDVTISRAPIALPQGVQQDDQYILNLTCAGRDECYTDGLVQPRFGADHGFFDQSKGTTWTPAAVNGDPATVPGAGPIACPASGECHSLAGGTEADLAGGAWTTHTIPVTLAWQGLACPVSGQCEAYGVPDLSATTPEWPTFVRVANGTAVSTPGGSIAGGTPDVDGNQQIVCPKVDSCVQWGTYKTADGRDLAYAQTAVGAGWQIRSIPIPGGAAATSSVLQSVTCAKAGECVGYGNYSTDGTTFHQMKVTLTGGTLSSADLPTDTSTTAALDGAAFTAIACSSEDHCDAVATLPATDGGHGRGLLARLVGGTWTSTVASAPTRDVSYSGIACPQDGFCVASGGSYGTEPGSGYPDPEAEVTFDSQGQITAVPTHWHQTSTTAIACAPGTRTCTVSAGDTSPASYSAFHLDITD